MQSIVCTWLPLRKVEHRADRTVCSRKYLEIYLAITTVTIPQLFKNKWGQILSYCRSTVQRSQIYHWQWRDALHRISQLVIMTCKHVNNSMLWRCRSGCTMSIKGESKFEQILTATRRLLQMLEVKLTQKTSSAQPSAVDVDRVKYWVTQVIVKVKVDKDV